MGYKKRVFIAIQYLELGGAERALLGLLNAFDYSKYDVDLFVYRHGGELFDQIPQPVNLLPESASYAAILKPIKDIALSQPAIALGRLLAKLDYRKYPLQQSSEHKDDIRIYHCIAERVCNHLPKINSSTEYDLAISFLIPHQYVLQKVQAKKKVAWIHTDYSSIILDAKAELPIWDGYDHIASISDDVTKGFLSVFPSLSGKIIQIENILSSNFIRQQAECPIEDMQPETDEIKLLSIGRFCYPKAFDRAVWICKALVDSGLKLKWYIIGYGDEAPVRKAIAESRMQDHFVILGKKSNPYPYIKACDIYVQPSRYEGKAVTVREAQVLCKPIIITDYPTAKSQVENNIDGVIVPNEIEGAAIGIKKLIEDCELQEKLVSHLQSCNYGMEEEIEKLYEIIEND